MAAGFASIDFAVDAGEIVALMGVEGSGARELLRSFAGLERCSRRRSTIDGETGVAASPGALPTCRRRGS